MSEIKDKQQIFLDNKELIYFTLKKYFPHIYYNVDSREEYFQIGSIGLLKAINHFNENLNNNFSTYAVPMIWGEIKRNLRDNKSSIHYSRKIIDIGNTIKGEYIKNDIEEEFETFLIKKLNELDLSYHEKMGVVQYLDIPMSLNQTINNDESKSISLEDAIPDNNLIEYDIEYSDYIFRISNSLSDRDKQIFKLLLENRTQMEIATKLGVSQAHISRIEKNIKMQTIKQLFNSGYYDTAFDKIYQIFGTNADINEVCYKYRIDLSKCPKNILEKRNIMINTDLLNNCSKKLCQKIILKAAIKSILTYDCFNNINFKDKVKIILSKSNYNNDSIYNHLENMTKSQVISCISLANKTIKKYNYINECEIVIDESEFVASKNKKHKKDIIEKTNIFEDKINSNNSKENNLIDSILSLLEQFKRDNAIVRF